MDDTQLTKLVLTHLGRIPGWVWSETGYTATDVGLFYGPIEATPDQAVGVTVYGGVDERTDHLRWRRLQLRIRGDKRRADGADVLADLALLVLPSLSLTVGSGISGVSRQSFSPLGQDGNGRFERTENYIITLDNKEAQQ